MGTFSVSMTKHDSSGSEKWTSGTPYLQRSHRAAALWVPEGMVITREIVKLRAVARRVCDVKDKTGCRFPAKRVIEHTHST